MFKVFGHSRKRVHTYQQLEFSDCGYACMRMICRYYGWGICPEYLREITDCNRLGLSIGEIKNALTRLGLECETVRVKIDEVDFMPLPAILYWRSKHFVVLSGINIKKRTYTIIDPAEGRMTLKKEAFEEAFITPQGNGIALVMDSTPQFIINRDNERRFESKTGLLKLLRQSFSNNRRSFIFLALLTVITLGADIAIPFIFQNTVDRGISSRDVHLVWLLVLSQLMVFIGSYVANCIIEIIITKLGLNMSISMLNGYLSKLIRLPMTFFAKKVSSDLIQKAEDHNRIKNFLLSVPNAFFFSTISFLVFSILLVVFSPLIFVIFIGFTGISLLWTTMFLRFRREIDTSLVAKVAENRNNLYELIDGIEEIKSNNAHRPRVKIWKELQEKINNLSIKSTFYPLYQSGGNSFWVRLRDILIMGISACLVIDGSMTIGVMMTVSYIVGRLSIPFNTLFNSINEIQDAGLSYRRIEEIQNLEIPDDAIETWPDKNNLRFDNVSFKYPGAGSPMVLTNISLDIKEGESVAIVGSSGSGKSTMIKLIASFFPPTFGKITIGGRDLKILSESIKTQKIAVVLQNGKIFSGTILSNIALCDEKSDHDRAIKATRIACIDDFINRLPLGLYTRIGKTGLDLSGGQQQRILLARAIYRNPEVLILDEATSAMDAITEARIMKNIFEHFAKNTLIIAAHRLSTVKDSDNIFVIKDGQLTEKGTHEELLQKEGEYSRLVNRQI